MRRTVHRSEAGVAVAIALISLAHASDSLPPPPAPSAAAAQARNFLRAGRLPQAEQSIRTALEMTGADVAWSLAGELALRRGDFESAQRSLQRSVALNPSNARAWWGLGRIEQLHFRRDAARDLFARAYRLDPRDPDVLLSYLNFVTAPAARAVLLRNLIALVGDTEPERAMHARGQLELETRLAGREPGLLASPYVAYRIPLSGFRPAGHAPRGLIATARINGGRPLRLLLDTGARGLLLHKSAARDLNLELLAASQVGGLGRGAPVESTLSLASTVAFGDLEFRNCLIEVSSRVVAEDVDGVLPPSLFEGFLLRIDAGARVLALTPRLPSDEPLPADAPTVLNLDNLLLVRTEISGGHGGWFLLDTGAAFTSVRTDSASPGARTASVDLAGTQGAVGAFRVAPVSMKVAGRSLPDPEAIALDLGRLSHREGIEIAGILGYSTLSRWPVTIDFRNGLVRLGDSQ